ncbi:MAG: FG-GAP-like repeat-containing protein [Ferruginibacter sp.]
MKRKSLLAGIFLLITSVAYRSVELPMQVSENVLFHFSKAGIPFWETNKQKNTSTDTASLKQSNWYAEAMKGIEETEYEIKYDANTKSYASPNRQNNLRAFYTADKFTLKPRDDSADKWKLDLTLQGIYSGKQKIYSPDAHAAVTQSGKTIRFNHNNNFTVEYINNEEGVRQNFIINREPLIQNSKLKSKNGEPPTINIKLQTNNGWFANKVHDKEIHFAKATKTGYDKKITYNGLKVWDANNKELEASFAVNENEINIDVVTQNAVYPITIDPLSTGTTGTPDWVGDDADQVNAYSGLSVASAGDVNGDGYSDVIVGAYAFDDGANTDEGRAFVYYGSATGLSTTPNSTPDDADQANAYFGISVATAGDVNGDGYSDVIIGASGYTEGGNVSEGRAFVYYGSVAGLSASPNNTPDDADQANAVFGVTVACAGDVNGDGYSDVIIGAYGYDDGPNVNEGRAFVYHGSAAGLSASPDSTPDDANQADARFGVWVASAGDVNGDGYSDVIIGAHTYDDGANTDEGRAFVYYGSATGISNSPDSTPDDADQPGAAFGRCATSAGDVNGDGYSDVIIGAFQYDDGVNSDEGRAFVYYGSAAGLSSSPNVILDNADQAGAFFGWGVFGAGDVNGDGYSDVIIGAPFYDDGANVDEGRAFVYYGSSTGLNVSPVSIPDDANQAGAFFGWSITAAGDVNGDGYSDVIIGAPNYDDGANTNEGRAFVYHGSASGISTTASTTTESNQANTIFGIFLSSAGDVNGDGYSDIIVGAPWYDNGETDEGRAFIFHGSPTGINPVAAATVESDQAATWFGRGIACAGDVNGDGYSDVIVGAFTYDNGQTDEGAAFVYHGSPTGINTTAAAILESNQGSANFGISVAGAGDINGDGYSDVIVGANLFDNGQTDEGAAFVYYGSATGVNTVAVAILESNQGSANFGISVAGAGDINGDGYSDIIVGANMYDNGQSDEGAAFVYNGSLTGINIIPAAIVESNQAFAQYGWSVAAAGDVNGDAFSDIIVGAWDYDNGQTAEGAAFVYHGSATGVNTTAAAILEPNQADANYGISVASAGDVNGDGYSDVVAGAYFYDNGQPDEGGAFVYHGSSTGVSTTAAAILESNQAISRLGACVASAGDVNGDGYSDVVVGAYFYDNGETDEGAAFVYLGNGGGGKRNNLRLYNQDLVTPIQRINYTEPNLFGVGLYAKSPLGRVKGKLVWEVKKQGIPFSGNPITNSTAFLAKQPSFANLGIAGTELKYNVAKQGLQNKIRARVEYDKVTAITGQVYGPWRYPPGYTQGAYGMNAAPLPITLISFNGQFINENDVQLKWITSNEINLETYVVQRSKDGINFIDVGLLPATGQGSNRTDYSFTDKNVKQNLLYYRLRLKDRGGELSYTKIITLNRSKIVKGFIGPNPVLRGSDVLLTMQSTSDKSPVHINIYNSSGQRVYTNNKILQAGKNEIILSTNNLSKGIYIVYVLSDWGKDSYRLVVR